jgi:hypothetical protein
MRRESPAPEGVPVERFVGMGFVRPRTERPVSGVWSSVASRPVPPALAARRFGEASRLPAFSGRRADRRAAARFPRPGAARRVRAVLAVVLFRAAERRFGATDLFRRPDFRAAFLRFGDFAFRVGFLAI